MVGDHLAGARLVVPATAPRAARDLAPQAFHRSCPVLIDDHGAGAAGGIGRPLAQVGEARTDDLHARPLEPRRGGLEVELAVEPGGHEGLAADRALACADQRHHAVGQVDVDAAAEADHAEALAGEQALTDAAFAQDAPRDQTGDLHHADVTAIVEQPWGGYPSIVPDYYDYDWKWIVDYGKTNRKPKEEVRAYWRQYVAETKDFLLFGSEIKAIFASGLVPREIDRDSLDDLFSLSYPCPPRTMFVGVRELRPGHLLTAMPGREVPAPRRWWRVHFPAIGEHRKVSFRDAAQELRELLLRKTYEHLRADVPAAAAESDVLNNGAARVWFAADAPDA